MVTTQCHYGCVHYWWLCPQCGQRCRILYAGAVFVCRSFSGAYYETQASEEIAGMVILFSYGETVSIGEPGTAADMKEQLQWLMRKPNGND